MRVRAIGLAMALWPGSVSAQEGAASQVRTLELHRVELRPYVGWALWPDSLTRAFVGGDVGYRVDPMLAFELDGALYAPFNVGEGAKPVYPLNEAQGSVDFDVAFFPLARLGGWGNAPDGPKAGALEPFVLGGLGLVRTRPVAVIDPLRGTYDWNNLVDLDFGAGLRGFPTRWLAIELDVRDLVYYERREALPITEYGNAQAFPANVYDPNTHFTNAIQFRFGASFFTGW